MLNFNGRAIQLISEIEKTISISPLMNAACRVEAQHRRKLTLPDFRRTLVAFGKIKRPEPKFNQNHFA
jgi:hypothetical protein